MNYNHTSGVESGTGTVIVLLFAIWFSNLAMLWEVTNPEPNKRTQEAIMTDNLEWVKWQLSDLANSQKDDIESGELDILGEDEHGVEGVTTVDISDIAQQALDTIIKLQEELKRELEKTGDDKG